MLVAEKIYGAGHKLTSEDYDVLPMPKNTVLVYEIDYGTAEASLCEEECFESALANQDIEELHWCYEFFYGLELSDDDLIRYHNRRQHCAKIAPKNECAGLLPPVPEENKVTAQPARLERIKSQLRADIAEYSMQIKNMKGRTNIEIELKGQRSAFVATLKLMEQVEIAKDKDLALIKSEEILRAQVQKYMYLMQNFKDRPDIFGQVEGYRNGFLFAQGVLEDA